MAASALITGNSIHEYSKVWSVSLVQAFLILNGTHLRSLVPSELSGTRYQPSVLFSVLDDDELMEEEPTELSTVSTHAPFFHSKRVVCSVFYEVQECA